MTTADGAAIERAYSTSMQVVYESPGPTLPISTKADSPSLSVSVTSPMLTKFRLFEVSAAKTARETESTITVQGGFRQSHQKRQPGSQLWTSHRRLIGIQAGCDKAIIDTIDAYVRGHAISHLAEQEARRRSGLDTQQWMQAQASYVQTIIDSGDHPMLTKVIRDPTKPHDPDSTKHGFRTGLEQILDGIATNLDHRDSGDGSDLHVAGRVCDLDA